MIYGVGGERVQLSRAVGAERDHQTEEGLVAASDGPALDNPRPG